MPHLPALRLAAIVGLLLGIAGCHVSRNDMNTSDPETETADVGPRYKLNPHPKDAYRITMTIADAPGPFASIIGLAQYDVVNPECLPPPKDNPGEHLSPIPTTGGAIDLKQISDTEYTGIVYADHMLDKDYHGRGVCRWKLIQAQVQLKATGAPEETLFIPSIPEQKIIEAESEITYFRKSSYPGKHEMKDMPSIGQTDRSKMDPEITDQDLFTITFAARKEAP